MTPREAWTSPERHPLSRGASPDAIHEALLPEDRARFRVAFEAAMDEAKRGFDLAPVHAALEDWRRLAVAQSDPVGWRFAVRRAAELQTGHTPPEDEPVSSTRPRAGF